MAGRVFFLRRVCAYWYGRIGVFILSFLIYSGVVYFSFRDMEQTPASLFFLINSSFIIAFAASATTESLRAKGRWRAFGLRVDKWAVRDKIFGFAVATGSTALFLLAGLALGGDYFLVGDSEALQSGAYFAKMTIIYLFAAAFEEIIFRGVVFQALIDRFNPYVVSVAASAVFSLLHAENASYGSMAFVNTFLVGIFLSLVVVKTRSLWAAISYHFFWNFLQDAFFSAHVSGIPPRIGIFALDFSGVDAELTFLFGGVYGFEEGALTTIALLASIFLAAKYLEISPYTASRLYKIKFAESEIRG